MIVLTFFTPLLTFVCIVAILHKKSNKYSLQLKEACGRIVNTKKITGKDTQGVEGASFSTDRQGQWLQCNGFAGYYCCTYFILLYCQNDVSILRIHKKRKKAKKMIELLIASIFGWVLGYILVSYTGSLARSKDKK
ncbi:hypothetical protein LS74_010265 [Helicobacter magdeburgensis]|uniref:Uncharacterized protein n=1 Tax=Helicobacter magdeburgensis TaxID=471858 RepID=A0A4U8SW41_9HELI|nr:hypothetical protein LS74_010265 [Helicobacter magdeburgensis]